MENLTKSCIFKDFPIKGVKFVDIFPLLEQGGLERVRKMTHSNKGICILPEARGFLFYPCLGTNLVLPLRKKNKLPGNVVGIPFTKEYGQDSFFFQKEALIRLALSYSKENSEESVCPVIIFDDVLATGGTVEAIYNHFDNLSVLVTDGFATRVIKLKVVKAQFFLEIDDLQGRKRLEDLGLEVESSYHFKSNPEDVIL